MAGSKRVPLTLGEGGQVIGSAIVDENGFIMCEIDDLEVTRELYPQDLSFSIYIPGQPTGG